jgi:hypothetical protein
MENLEPDPKNQMPPGKIHRGDSRAMDLLPQSVVDKPFRIDRRLACCTVGHADERNRFIQNGHPCDRWRKLWLRAPLSSFPAKGSACRRNGTG